jgi:hypothetical protein
VAHCTHPRCQADLYQSLPVVRGFKEFKEPVPGLECCPCCTAEYCSAACQQQDAAEHAQLCARMARIQRQLARQAASVNSLLVQHTRLRSPGGSNSGGGGGGGGGDGGGGPARAGGSGTAAPRGL